MDLTGQYFCNFKVKGQNFDEEFKIVLEATVSVFDKNERLKKKLSSKLSSTQVLIKRMMKHNLERGFDLSKLVFGEQVSTYSDETTPFKKTRSDIENTAEDSGERNMAKGIHDNTKNTNSDKNNIQITQKLRLDCFWVHLPENELGNSTGSGLSGETPSIAVQQVTPDTSDVLHNVKKEPVGIDNSGFDNRRDNELHTPKLQPAVKKNVSEFNPLKGPLKPKLIQTKYFQKGCLTNVNDSNYSSEQNPSTIERLRNYIHQKSLMENAQLKKDSISYEDIPSELGCLAQSGAQSGILAAGGIGNSFWKNVTFNHTESSLNTFSSDHQQKQLVKVEDVIDDQNQIASSLGRCSTSRVINTTLSDQDSCAHMIKTLTQSQNIIMQTFGDPNQASVICNDDLEHERGKLNLTDSLSADHIGLARYETCSTFDLQKQLFTKVKPKSKYKQLSVGADRTYRKSSLKPKRLKMPSKTLSKLKSVRKNRWKKHKVENIFDDDLNSLNNNLENSENTLKNQESENLRNKNVQAPETNLRSETDVQDVYVADETEYNYQLESPIQSDIEYNISNNSTDNATEDVYGRTTENDSSGRNLRRRCRKNISYQKLVNFYDSVDFLEDDTDFSSGSDEKSDSVKDTEFEPTELSDPSYSDGEHYCSSAVDDKVKKLKKHRTVGRKNKKEKLKSEPSTLQIDLSEHRDKYEIIQVVSKEQRDRGKPIEDISFSSFACTLCQKYKTKDEDRLKSHLELHLRGKLKCFVCGLECITEYHKRNHIKMEHPEKRNQSDYTVCEICGKDFLKASRKIHMYNTHNISIFTYECRFCSVESRRKYGYMNSKELDKHVKSEHPEQLFSCDKCDRQFSILSLYKSHSATCKGKTCEENICSICGAVLANRARLRLHIRLCHQKEKKFKCDLCPYVAFFKSSLDRHMNAAHLSKY